MTRWFAKFGTGVAALMMTGFVNAAGGVPNEIQTPGIQTTEVGNFESPDRCDSCHATSSCSRSCALGE